jgi:hypothetical protein
MKDRNYSLMFGESYFIHINGRVSNHAELCHKYDGYFIVRGSSSSSFGINKREYRASSCGKILDRKYIGQSR